MFFLAKHRGSARCAEFLRGTAVLSHRVLPIPRVPPNVVSMDEGSRAKDERKKKSVRKARGDRSITNHYGPSGTTKRTSTTIRCVFLFRNVRLYSRMSHCTNYISYILYRFILSKTEQRKKLIRRLITKRRSTFY